MVKRRLTRKEIGKRRNRTVIISTLCLLFVMTIGYAAFSTNLSITAKGNIKDLSRVIQSWNSVSNSDFHTDYYRENIVSATFLDNNNVPDNATERWNVSEDKKHGGVMAWVVPNSEDMTKYDLYIGAKDGVVANEDSSFLFYEFTSVNSIVFNSYFDTSQVINMDSMFYHCSKLEKLDLSNFDTSNVTNMSGFLAGGNSLTSLDLSNFDTRNVTNMNHMFSSWYAPEPQIFQNSQLKEIILTGKFSTISVTDMVDMFSGLALEELDLSNFNTENVISMYHMFRGCYNLTSLNLCTFNTDKVQNMEGMFSNMKSLTNVFVGPNWTTANANTANMFENSVVSEVTTGMC